MSEQELDKLSALALTAQEKARLESSLSISNKESSIENLSKLDDSGVHQANQSNRSIFLVAKSGSIVLVGSLFAYTCQLAIGFMLTRLLGAEQFGQYKVALTTGQIACSFAFLGMDVALVRFVSLFASQRDTSGLRGTLQVGVGVSTLLGLLIGVGLYVFATPLALHVFHDSLLIPLLRLASLIVPLSALAGILASVIKGFNKMQYNAWATNIAQPLTRLTLLLPMALLGLSALKAMTVFIVGLMVTCALLLYFLNRIFPLRRSIQTAHRDAKGILRFSLPIYFSNLIDTFGPNLQTILLGSLNTMTTVGIFAAASQISMAGSMFNSSIGTASDPLISELHGKENREEMSHFYKTTTKWMFTVNLPMFLIVLLLSEPILKIFGKEFMEGSTALIILALANLVNAAAGISDGFLAMTGNTRANLANSVVQTLLSIGLCFLLIPRWGAVGAAMAALVSTIVLHLLLVLEIFFFFRMLPYTVDFYKPIIAGLVTLFVAWLPWRLVHTETNLILAVMHAFVILVAYVGMILLLGLSTEDRAIFAQLRKRIVGAFSRK